MFSPSSACPFFARSSKLSSAVSLIQTKAPQRPWFGVSRYKTVLLLRSLVSLNSSRSSQVRRVVKSSLSRRSWWRVRTVRGLPSMSRDFWFVWVFLSPCLRLVCVFRVNQGLPWSFFARCAAWRSCLSRFWARAHNSDLSPCHRTNLLSLSNYRGLSYFGNWWSFSLELRFLPLHDLLDRNNPARRVNLCQWARSLSNGLVQRKGLPLLVLRQSPPFIWHSSLKTFWVTKKYDN